MEQATINTTNIEIKKIILSGLQTNTHALTEKIHEIILELQRLSDSDSPQVTDYIELAVQYIHAYLQLGFSYLEHKTIFDTMLYKAGFSTEYISNLQKINPTVKLNKSKLRSIMGRWPASAYNSHTVTEAIDEIIFHTLNQDIGVYKYFTSRKNGTYITLYQLTISSDYALFHDVFQNKYYSLTC